MDKLLKIASEKGPGAYSRALCMRETARQLDLVSKMLWPTDEKLEFNDSCESENYEYEFKRYLDNPSWAVSLLEDCFKSAMAALKESFKGW